MSSPVPCPAVASVGGRLDHDVPVMERGIEIRSSLRLPQGPDEATETCIQPWPGPSGVKDPFQNGSAQILPTSACPSLQGPRPCLETLRLDNDDGDDDGLSFQPTQRRCASDRSRPRAKLTRCKAVTRMRLELSPSPDCYQCTVSTGGPLCSQPDPRFVLSPSASYTSSTSISSSTVPQLASPEDGDAFDCFTDFHEEEYFGPVAPSPKEFGDKPGPFCDELSSLGLFFQQPILPEDSCAVVNSLTETAGEGCHNPCRFGEERSVKEECQECSPIQEESPIAALLEADEQLKMAPDVGSSCSDLSAMTSSSPTLSTFTSNRSSARSSFTSRRSKRSLSISPTSTDGMDLNTIIRCSPTSLVAYLSGSRCSSTAGVPSAPGAYGHLSARPNSPRSGSSGLRLSTPYSPTVLKLATRDDCSAFDNPVLTLQAIDEVDQFTGMRDYDFLEPEDNLAVIKQQEDRDLAVGANFDFGGENVVDSTQQPLPGVTSILELQKPPPPSYDQHMARKLAFQKMYSSDSSQPSNYSSFESTGSADTASELAEVDSTTSEPVPRSYDCQWIDCRGLFQDQESLVRHIEACHIDQRVRDEYTCFWQGCPRRHRPFNARYKLLIHMRVHSGEKPNRCTFEGCAKAFSRLENLKIHLRSHTGERPYSCQYPGCPKAFSNSSDRAKHQRTHQDTKPYACQVPGCCKRYTDPSSLRKHYKNHAAKDDTARKKIRSENDVELVSGPGDCLEVQPAYAARDRPKLEHADSGIGRSPGASSVNDCCYQGGCPKPLQLSLSDNDLACRSSPHTRFAPSPGLAEDKLHPQGYPIPPLRSNSFTEPGMARSPTRSVVLEVPRSELCAMSFGGFHSCSTPSPRDQRDSQGSAMLAEDDLEPLMTLNMSDLHVLGHLGDSVSSREDSADEGPVRDQASNYQPLPPFDAFYSCLGDLPHFGGVS